MPLSEVVPFLPLKPPLPVQDGAWLHDAHQFIHELTAHGKGRLHQGETFVIGEGDASYFELAPEDPILQTQIIVLEGEVSTQKPCNRCDEWEPGPVNRLFGVLHCPETLGDRGFDQSRRIPLSPWSETGSLSHEFLDGTGL